MSFKDEKLKELIKTLAAEYFLRTSNRTSLITITQVDIRNRGGTAVIMFTVLPETQEQAALDFMHRQLTEFKEYVKEHARMMRIPYFEVQIDMGEKNRQMIETLT